VTDGFRTADPTEYCAQLLHRLAGYTKGPDAEWLALDVGMGQLKAMVVLKDHGRQTVGGLARLLKIAEPSASLLVDKLVSRELVKRDTDPEDRRRTLVALSPAGDDLMIRLRRSREDQLRAWLEGVGGDDLRALTQGVEALLAVLDKGGVGGTLDACASEERA
jgi:DNA-binding MarR family transcriptional regulator